MFSYTFTHLTYAGENLIKKFRPADFQKQDYFFLAFSKALDVCSFFIDVAKEYVSCVIPESWLTQESIF